ncbi:hypothetical protein KCP70_00140 [Salmonella enterica subsp. enterica]|nr:hypothetical protein KCP70_00140 [Salmonella enterica subsp. enterica]
MLVTLPEMKVEIRLAAKSGAGGQLFPRQIRRGAANGVICSSAATRFGGELRIDKQGGYSAAMCESVELCSVHTAHVSAPRK